MDQQHGTSMHLRLVDAFRRSILRLSSISGPGTIFELIDDSTGWSIDQSTDRRSFYSPTLGQISRAYPDALTISQRSPSTVN